MPNATTPTEVLQKAGAAVHEAHAALDAAVKQHSIQVAHAVNANPFGLENDSLFNNWRTLAGVVQELQSIEQNLRALHATVTSLSADSSVVVTDVPRLPAPSKAKTKPAKAKPPAKSPAAKKPQATKTNPAAAAGQGNDAKVLAHLKTLLTSDSFTKIVQAQVADAVGIPKGSIGRSVSQLVIHGKLQAGDKGTYKLV